MTGWEAYHPFRDGFAKVLDPRRYTLDWLDFMVATGRVYCFAAEDAAILFQLKFYPTGAFDIDGLAATGNVDCVVQTLIPAACEFGRSIGAIGAIIQSRTAWARLLKDQGFYSYQTSLRKDL